jgi:putative membrane protein
MLDLLASIYLWLRAGHIIFVIFWMAGLFILPRQLIYMYAAPSGSAEEALWVKRIGLLRKMILTPGLVVVWLLGIALAVTIGAWDQGWFHAKLLLVLLLSGYHGWMIAMAKKMGTGDRPIPEKTLRLLNEVPATAVALIVVLAVVKPF